MKMIVGLGNPGKEYENTRHNIGFMIIDEYARCYNVTDFKTKFNGLYAKVYRNGEYFVLLKPLSFMNLSGTVVSKFADYFKIKPKDILVIHDDLDLPVGKIKLKFKGSSGGHNGIKSIIDSLNTEFFPRFKIGISKNSVISTKDYVIGRFQDKELQTIEKIYSFSCDIINDFISRDFEKIMSKYNGADYEIR
jgi:PTH1 family peptidyl-tRNA hydrolase